MDGWKGEGDEVYVVTGCRVRLLHLVVDPDTFISIDLGQIKRARR